MATTPFRFLQRRTSTSGRIPEIESLLSGELYLQLADETIYFRNDKNELVAVITDGDKFGLDKIKFTGASSGDIAVWNGSKFIPYSTGNLVGDLETGALSSIFAAINHGHIEYVSTGSTGSFITTSMTGAFGGGNVDLSSYVTTGQTGNFVVKIETGNFITTSMTGAFGGASGIDLTNYVTTASTGDFVTTSQTGAFAPTGEYVIASQTGNFASINGGHLLSSQIPTITGDVCIFAGSNNALICKIQGYPVSNAAPINGQTLQFNGTSWVPGDIPAGGNGGGGLVYYFNNNVAPDSPTANLPASISGTFELGRSGVSSQLAIQKTNLLTSFESIVGFVTDVLDPSVEAIPAGLFDFNIWASSNSPTDVLFQIKVYKYNGSNSPTLLATSNDIYTYDDAAVSQYAASVILPQTTLSTNDRLYVELLARALNNNHSITFYFGGNTPSHMHTTVPSVGGSGLVKVINGVMQSTASLITNSDISGNAAIDASKIQSGVFALCSETGIFETTGYARMCYVTTSQTGQFAPSGDYVTTSQTGQFAPSGSYVTTSQTGNFDYIKCPSLPSAGCVLCYNGSNWIVGTAAGGGNAASIEICSSMPYSYQLASSGSVICGNFGSSGAEYSVILGGESNSISGSGLFYQDCLNSFNTSGITALAYGSGLYLAVSTGGRLATSVDGVNWTQQTSSFATTGIRSVIYGSGLYVAAGDCGRLAISSNGSTWTQQTSSFLLTGISGLIYGNGCYVIAGSNGKLATSPDGCVWTSRTGINFGATGISTLAYGNGLFVAAGACGRLATSTDATGWTQQTSSFGTTGINCVIYANSLFVAAGAGGRLATSTDGTGWTQRTSSFGTTGICTLGYGKGLYFAGGISGTLAYSFDACTWNQERDFTLEYGSVNAVCSIVFGDQLLIGGTLTGRLTCVSDANYTINLIQNSENAKLVKTCNSAILNSKNSCLVCACDSIILGGSGNNLSNVCNSIILGSNITGTVSNTTYVNDLCVSGGVFGTGFSLGKVCQSNIVIGTGPHIICNSSCLNTVINSSGSCFGASAAGAECRNTILNAYNSFIYGEQGGLVLESALLNTCSSTIHGFGIGSNHSCRNSIINGFCSVLNYAIMSTAINACNSCLRHSVYGFLLNGCQSCIIIGSYGADRNVYINGSCNCILNSNVFDVSILHGFKNLANAGFACNLSIIGNNNCITGTNICNSHLIGSGITIGGTGINNIYGIGSNITITGDSLSNVYVIGSNITGTSSNTTYVNNLCVVNGIISGNGAGITGLLTGDFVTQLQTGQFAPSGDYVTATQTGTLNNLFAPSGNYVTATQTGTLVCVFAPNGNYVTTSQTGQFAPSGNYVTATQTGTLVCVFAPNGDYVTTSQTGQFASSGNYVTATQTGTLVCVFAPNGNYVTTSQTGQFAPSGNYVTTGQTGVFIVNNSGINTIYESATVCNTGAGGNLINFDVIPNSTLYYVRNSTGNFYINLRGSSSCTFNALLPLNNSLSVSVMHVNGATPYALTGVNIDGSATSVIWAGGGGTPSGVINATNVYSITTFKTGDNLFRVFGSLGFFS